MNTNPSSSRGAATFPYTPRRLTGLPPCPESNPSVRHFDGDWLELQAMNLCHEFCTSEGSLPLEEGLATSRPLLKQQGALCLRDSKSVESIGATINMHPDQH